MANNQLTSGRTGYVIPDRLYDLSRVDRMRIISENRGRIVRDIDRNEDVYVAGSLRLSRARIGGALGVRCITHDAAPGVYCFGGRLSGVRGLCDVRYECGVGAAARPAFLPDELADVAQAARYAQRRMPRANWRQTVREVSR